MTQRSYRMYAQGYSDDGQPVAITVTFNNSTVFNGTIPALAQSMPVGRVDLTQAPITWQADLDLTGTVPMSISVTGGSAVVGLIEANYCGMQIDVDPVTEQYILVQDPVDVWQDPNDNDGSTDGKLNLMLNDSLYNGGVPIRATDGTSLGDGTVALVSGDVLTFDFYVDPTLIWTVPPMSIPS